MVFLHRSSSRLPPKLRARAVGLLAAFLPLLPGPLLLHVKLKEGRFSLDIRKRFFSKRVVAHWNRLHSELVTAPSLSEFMKELDCALRHMV